MRRCLSALSEQLFDVLILGGGITGAGVALDAALRGLSVALIDKGDFASGTSSVSSKLIHGGLRYLEQGQVKLVWEALHERAYLLHNAPHLVRPLRFFLPLYRTARLPAWQARLGLVLYDLLAGRHNLHRSQPRTAKQLLQQIPGLRSRDLEGGLEYFDAQMEDARLCLEVVRSAAEAGACVCNYVEACDFLHQGGRLVGVQARDQVSGAWLTIRARQLVNATGPWLDVVCRRAGDNGPPKLQPTRGVHVLAPDRGLRAALLLLHPADGRVFFVIPWMGRTLLGTTDTPATTGPDAVPVEPADIQYLLEGYNHYLQPALRTQELCGSFAGLRPLLRSPAAAPSQRSREFRLFVGPGGLLSIAGGKYTTYRRMAEVATDWIAAQLGWRLPCRTQAYRLTGAPPGPWGEFAATATARLATHFGLPAEAAQHLVARYGRHAFAVAAGVHQYPDGLEPLYPGEPDLRLEIPYQQQQEMALFPADHLLRRTRLGLFHPELLSGNDGLFRSRSSCSP
jgi:glycerol-3-phosphate dehydrogenase